MSFLAEKTMCVVGVLAIACIMGFNALAFDDEDHNNNWNGAVDRQSEVRSSDDGNCTAYHKPTGSRLTVVGVTMERGGIMERYKVKEHGGRWYYSTAFTDLKCKSVFDKIFNYF